MANYVIEKAMQKQYKNDPIYSVGSEQIVDYISEHLYDVWTFTGTGITDNDVAADGASIVMFDGERRITGRSEIFSSRTVAKNFQTGTTTC